MTSLKVFVDFDGTITKNDVGNAFFRKYVGRERYDAMLDEYKSERISAQQCFRKGIEAIGNLNKEEASSFVRSYQIDPTFRDFVEFCREREIEFHVVSDGLDFYIKDILAANGIEGLSFFSNVLEFTDDSRSNLRLHFPHADAECKRCACCKRNIMLTHSDDEDIIVYVGEGYSDRCPVQYADVVFAKDVLQTFCQEQNISYHFYNSFQDVAERLALLLQKKRLHKRLAAEMKRKELFMREP